MARGLTEQPECHLRKVLGLEPEAESAPSSAPCLSVLPSSLKRLLRWGGDGAVTELTESVLTEFTSTLEASQVG